MKRLKENQKLSLIFLGLMPKSDESKAKINRASARNTFVSFVVPWRMFLLAATVHKLIIREDLINTFSPSSSKFKNGSVTKLRVTLELNELRC